MKRAWLAVIVLVAATAWSRDPGSRTSLAAVRAAYVPSDARLLDRHGEVLHELRIDKTRRRLEWTALESISPALIDAVLVSEDGGFRRHGGVDFRAVAAALWGRLLGRPLRGASTLSMQLAALLDPELRRGDAPRSLTQKWAQMRAAWRLEQTWSKDEILEAYLNLVSFRGELQGVAAASAVLFDKQPHGLSTAESLVLAALLRAPNATAEILHRRVKGVGQGFHPPPTGPKDPSIPQIADASDLPLALRDALARVLDHPHGTGPRVKLAPHVARLLLTNRARLVHSTIDADVQRFAADAVRRHLLALHGREVRDGAVLVADNASGEVLAYVGSSGGLSGAAEVDGVRARRQAGSSLKPFLYAAAIDARLVTPATLLEDAPLEIAVGGGLYRPQNYDEEFRGLVSVRAALAGSLNVPSVRVLQLVGTDSFSNGLRRLGFVLDRAGDDYGPSLALGSADVSLWELVRAYAALANGGLRTPLALLPQAARPRAADRDAVFSPEAAFLVADILADRESRTITFGLENVLATRFWSAVKTGTSKDMRDNWAIGFSRRYTVGVWVGNFSGRPMHDVSGVSGAAPIWLEVMEWLHRDEPSSAAAPPAGLSSRRVAFAPAAEPERVEWFVRGTERPPVAPLGKTETPRILSPAEGTIIALDPDIPMARQRVLIQTRGAGTLLLDGAALPSSPPPLLWPPALGSHQLALVDASGRALHTVTFRVK